MASRTAARPGRSHLTLRRASFHDVPAVLRLIEGAVERGCAEHYDVQQRRMVFLSYAQSLFVDILGPFDHLVAEREDGLVGFAQLDPRAGRIRAVFVAAAEQNNGIGRELLAALETIARRHGLRVLHGAMSLNATAFYDRAGYRALGAPRPMWLNGVAVPVLNMEKALDAVDGPPRPRGLL